MEKERSDASDPSAGEGCLAMHLADLPFKQFQSGKKTVEVRLYDEKRRALKVGDVVLLIRMDGTEQICARVRALFRAPTFEELFTLPDMLSKAGFAGMSASDAARCMARYYSEEQERQYGVLGIELCDRKRS